MRIFVFEFWMRGRQVEEYAVFSNWLSLSSAIKARERTEGLEFKVRKVAGDVPRRVALERLAARQKLQDGPGQVRLSAHACRALGLRLISEDESCRACGLYPYGLDEHQISDPLEGDGMCLECSRAAAGGSESADTRAARELLGDIALSGLLPAESGLSEKVLGFLGVEAPAAGALCSEQACE